MPEQTVIILLGPPGAGKGTLAEKISKEKAIPHISTGDIFYEQLRNGTEHGLHARHYLDKGHLVPDDLVLDIIYDRVLMPDCSKGYILDGIPKNIAQVHEIEDHLRGKANVKVIKLDVNDATATKRLAGRLVCEKCGHVWHKETHNIAKEGVCDICGGKVVQRSDDTPEAIKERLKVYHEQTEPIENYYKGVGLLQVIDASKSPEDVLADILHVL